MVRASNLKSYARTLTANKVGVNSAMDYQDHEMMNIRPAQNSFVSSYGRRDYGKQVCGDIIFAVAIHSVTAEKEYACKT